MNQIVPIDPQTYSMLEKMGRTLLGSGFLPSSIKGPEQAIAIILAGRELGIAPWQALSTINVIQGKPTVSPQLMLALIQSSGQLESIHYDSNNTHCTVTMKRRGQPPHAETFNQDDAVAQNLWGKDNWKKQPKVMLRWRAVAACARIVFPDIILGLYTPEEMGADVQVTDDGNMTVIAPPAPSNGNGHHEAPIILPATTEATKWTDETAKAFVLKYEQQIIPAKDLKAALGIQSKWSEWDGTVEEADARVQAYLNEQMNESIGR